MTQSAAPAVPASPPASRGLDRSGVLLGLGGAFLFSWKPIFVKWLYAEGLDAETQLALRMLLAMPFFALVAWHALAQRRRAGIATDLAPRTLAHAGAIGIVGYYLASYLDFLGLKLITANFERLILFTYPTFVALLAWWLYRERPTRGLVGAIALTYAGLAVIFVHDLTTFGPQVTTGTLLVLACSLAYAYYLAAGKALIGRMGSQIFTGVAMFAGSVVLVGQFAATHPLGALAVSAHAFWLSLGLALGATVIPALMINEAIARIGPAPASIIGGAGPIMTFFLAVALLGEPLTLWHLAGMALVIAGVFVLTREKR